MRIEKARYEGYVWYSDRTVPEILTLDKEFGVEMDDSLNPFIVEAQLYAPEQELSLSIRYMDGKYHVSSFHVTESELRKNESDITAYRSHRMQGRILKFWQQWKQEPDEACLDMDTLLPAALVFIGFGKSDKSERP